MNVGVIPTCISFSNLDRFSSMLFATPAANYDENNWSLVIDTKNNEQSMYFELFQYRITNPFDLCVQSQYVQRGLGRSVLEIIRAVT